MDKNGMSGWSYFVGIIVVIFLGVIFFWSREKQNNSPAEKYTENSKKLIEKPDDKWKPSSRVKGDFLMNSTFKTQLEAKQRLSEFGFTNQHVEVLLDALVPTIIFEPDSREKAIQPAQTKIGGLPDLPKEIDWPVRAIPKNWKEISENGGSYHKAHISRYISREMPYEFIAQIDLTDTHELGDMTKDLPQYGRLLFFCDLSVVAWRDGIAESARVIWDRSDAKAIYRAALPQAFTDMIELEISDYLEQQHEQAKNNNEPMETREQYLAKGYVPTFQAPERCMNLKQAFSIPFQTHEFHENKSIQKIIEAEDGKYDLDAQLNELLWEWHEEEWEIFWGHRFMGYPQFPEQDDPRYGAGIAPEKLQELYEEKPKDKTFFLEGIKTYQLLLQIRLADYYQEDSEGTLYFLIPKDALKKHEFDKVIVYYQQT